MKKGSKAIYYLSISVGVAILVLAIIVKIEGIQYLKNIRDKIEYYITDKRKVLFIGDSLTERGKTWDNLYSNVIVVNCGKGGYTTEQITNTLDLSYADHANKILIMAGINDLARGKTPEETITSYAALLKKLNNSKHKITIQSVLPIDERMKDVNFPKYKATSQNILKLDSLLKNLCAALQIPYIDVYAHMAISKNQLNPDYTLDGVHLNKNGYDVWKTVLKARAPVR